MPDDVLVGLLEEPLNVDLPLSTVAVERAVKDTTVAARVCADPAEQDGFTFQTTAARAKHPYCGRDLKEWAI